MARKAKVANGRRYTDAEKMFAVQTVRVAGGTVTDEALRSIRLVLKAPALDYKTIVSWLKVFSTSAESPSAKNDSSNGSSNETPSIDFQRETALALVEHTFRNYAKRANEKTAVDVTEGKDAAKVMADMAKLMQLLQGMPTEITASLSELTELANFFREEGIEMTPALRDWRQRLKAQKELRGRVANG